MADRRRQGGTLYAVNNDTYAPVDSGGGPPHDGDMEARVAVLEVSLDSLKTQVGDVKAAMGRIETETSALKTEVAVMRERLSHMPTKLEMWTGVALVLSAVGGGLLWMVQQYLGPLLAKAAGG